MPSTTAAKFYPSLPETWKSYQTRGFNLATGHWLDLTLILKPDDRNAATRAGPDAAVPAAQPAGVSPAESCRARSLRIPPRLLPIATMITYLAGKLAAALPPRPSWT